MSGDVHAVLEHAKRLAADERIELPASVDEDEESGTQEEIEAAWDDDRLVARHILRVRIRTNATGR